MRILITTLFIGLIFSSLTAIAMQLPDSSYQESPLTLETSTGSIHGTLTTPIDFKKAPVVLIIAGSGPTDRDGNNSLMKNNSLLQLAHSLAAAGIASVRFDKRGIAASAASMKSESDIRFDDFVNDAKAWVALLKKDARFTKIIIAGHSEGSLIGMIAAREGVDKYISIAGAGKPAAMIIKDQLNNQSKQLMEMASPTLDSLVNGKTVTDYNPMLESLFRPSVQPYLISWFKYDPAAEINKLKIPVQIIQGTNDIQVSVNDAEILSKANPAASLNLINEMNHVLKIVSADKTENIKSYSNPQLPIAQEMVKVVVEFIKK